MSPFTTIITHPGSAHKDEFLACSVLLAVHPAPVLRREPAPADLADPAVVVADVGHRHEPALGNFDHHQFPKDHPPTCSLSLVLRHLGLYEDARAFFDWLEPAEWFDCRGAVDTARWLGVDRNIVGKLHSPIDGTLLRRFAQSDRHLPGEPLWEIMRMIGDDLLTYLRTLRDRLDFISRHASVWSLENTAGPNQILFMPRTDPLPDDPSAAIERYVENRGLGQEVIALVSPDRRGGGYGLSRHRDNARL
ncbi:MAG TPA: MYG1 family protein, partial [Rariglobus sp.]